MTARPSPLLLSAAVVSALALAGARLTARDTLMPVGDVKPGMVGTGRTVFQGDRIEEFKVHIIGTLKSVVAPQRDLILSRLEGGPLAETGVIAGMSGSPVYIDGKLVGAVSYQLGQFPKEPIAGITPIAEMTDATGLAATRASRPVAIALDRAVAASELLPIWRDALVPTSPFGAANADVLQVLGGAGLTRTAMTDLRPITVPITVGGFADGAVERLLPGLPGVAISATARARQRATGSVPRPLAPGDAVGVALLGGDFSMGATGTVTHVDGERVYAFGHPLYNLGPTLFPMTRADVIAVLPSLVTSSKLASLGATVGTISQDRATAIAGRLGAPPALIPMTVTLNSTRASGRTFRFEVVHDQLFTPLLSYLAVANVLTSYQRQTGAATYVVRGQARLSGQPPIEFDDVFVGDQGAANASAYVSAPLTALYRNANEPFLVEGITLTVDADEATRTAEIERVWIETDTVRPGRTMPVKIQLRRFEGGDEILTQDVTIPVNATGTLQLVVSDGPRAAAQDPRGLRAELQPVGQIVRQANRARHSDRVYVRLTAPAPGAVVDGEPLPGLPPSVAGVLDAERPSGGGTSLRTTTRGEWSLTTPYAVSGSRQLTITIDPS